MSSTSPSAVFEPLTAAELAALDEVEINRVRDAYVSVNDIFYETHPWEWMIQMVRTVDEASKEIRNFPEWEYLREVVEAIHTIPLLAIPKSRRMMVTWAAAAYVTWLIRYTKNVAAFWQSENEDKAAYVLDKRCQFMEDNQRFAVMKRPYRAYHTSKGAIGRLQYLGTRSYGWAIPQGGHVLRTYTPTILVMDESDFQEQGREALQAALPTVEKGARLVLISSSAGPRGVVADICREVGFVRFS